MGIFIVVDDLLFKTKIEGIIKSINGSITKNIYGADYIIVDLNHKEAFDTLKKFPEKSLCFCSHLDKEKLDKAKSLGCKNVYPRSLFFDKLRSIIK
ncbi:hypothetical protein HYX15_03695 [Candidatus Woesearchaeota archaeon]|nr:hypothetical protein [Candidatus Woesearchaeota archaeon]